MTDRLFGKKKTTMIALAAVVVAAIMVVPAAFAFIGQNTGTGVVGSIYSESGSHSITYKYDANGTKTMVANYYGIAATEYNPEYWLTYVDEVLSVDGNAEGTLYNWKGPSETVTFPLNASISSTKITLSYKFTVADDRLYINGLDITNDLDTAVPKEIISINCFDYTITNLPNAQKFSWNNHHFQFSVALVDDGNSNHHLSVSIEPANGKGTDISDGTLYSLDMKYAISTNYHLTINKVFGGWMNGSELVYPGDVVERSVTALTVNWVYPDIFLSQDSVPNHTDTIQNGKVVSELNPKNAVPYKVQGNTIGYGPGSNRYAYIDAAGAYQYKDASYGGDMFKTIYGLTNKTYGVQNTPAGTYRSLYVLNPDIWPAKTIITTGQFSLSGNCIFDNITFNTTGAAAKHGAGTNNGICANFNILILGTGIDCTTTTNGYLYAPTIFGGKNSGSVTSTLIEDKKIVSDSNSKFATADPVQLSTYVLVHSGVYSDAYAGSYNGKIGDASNYRSVYMVFKGGMVMDSLGATASNSKGATELYGGEVGCETNINYTGEFVTQGGSYIYCIGLKTPGNYFQDIASGWTGLDGEGLDGVHGVDSHYLYRDESAIVHAGCMNGVTYGCGHIFLSGKASLFDVQGGGRRAFSATGHTYVEINGKAEVRHIACGTITDGIEDSKNKNCVGGVDIIVGGDAKVGTVLGAGYDTYNYQHGYSSMLKGDINISIMGGTIAYVYGGGYRGSIGTTVASEKVNIHISMFGGTIVNDLYGGGRGGLDKVHNNPFTGNSFGAVNNNPPNGNDGYKETAGASAVRGNIDINLYGGTINGNVYGGGESLPAMKYYFSWTFNGNSNSTKDVRADVAVVYGDITVNVDGANIKGSVYGAGKGIDTTSSSVDTISVTKDQTTVDLYSFKDTRTVDLEKMRAKRVNDTVSSIEMPYYSLICVYNGSEYVYIPWNMPTTAITRSDIVTAAYQKTNVYYNHAELRGSSTVNVISGVIEGNVYGGGQISVAKNANDDTTADITTVNIEGGYIAGNVFGGGYGVLGQSSVKGVANLNIKPAGDHATTVGYVNGLDYFGMKVLDSDKYDDLSEHIEKKRSTTYRGATLQEVSYTKAGFDVCAVSGTSDGHTYTYFVMTKDGYTVDCTAMPVDTTGTTATQVLDLVSTAMSDYLTGAGDDDTLEDMAKAISDAFADCDDAAWGDTWVVGPIIGDSAYGGAENGKTQTTIVKITGGYITNNVFGAGLGASDYISVNGDSRLYISGGYIGGNTYGGAAFGTSEQNLYTFITGGRVAGDVYGGGLGRATYRSTAGHRGVIINDRDKLVDKNGNVIKYTVGGNVYGGSSEGNDGSDGASPSNSYIYIQSGAFTDSVFGGGFMGEIYGLTQIWLGYVFDESMGHVLGGEPGDVEQPGEGVPEDVIHIVESVYLGGNVREGVSPYTSELVHGVNGESSEMHINGRYSDIRVGGALMGSGNSCLTGGSTKFKASYFLDPLKMDGIHYFSKVGLFESILHIDGRETYFGGSAMLCSVSHIGALTLQDGSSLFIANLLEDVGALNSTTRDGTPTTTSSPFNKIVFTSGSTLYIRTMSGKTVTSYGNVTGYTTISVADNAPYGGYILGSKTSTGGFVIMRDGSYTIADKSDFVSEVAGVETHVCCWFISGVESRNITLTLPNGEKIIRGSVDVTKLQSTSQIRYVGGTYLSSSDTYDFFRPGLCKDEYFGLLFGFMNGDDDRMLKSDTSHFIGMTPAITKWRDSVYYTQDLSSSVEPLPNSIEDSRDGSGNAIYWDGFRYSYPDTDGRFDLKISDYNQADFNSKKAALADMLHTTVRLDNREFRDYSNFAIDFQLDDGKAVYVTLQDSYVVYFIMKVGDMVIDCSKEGLVFALKDASDDPISQGKDIHYLLGIFATALKNATGTKADLASSLETTLEAEGNRAWVRGWDVGASGGSSTLGFQYMWTGTKALTPTTLLTGSVTNSPAQGDLMFATFTPEEGQGEYTLNFQFCGAEITTTTYIGYVMIYLQEVNVIEYEVGGETKYDYIVSNRIEIRVDMYAEGKTAEANYDLELYTVDGAGSVDMIIPDGNTNASVYLRSWETDNDSLTELSFRGTKNVGKTNGWRDTVGSRTVRGNGTGDIQVGTLSGGYMATLNFTVANYNYAGKTLMTLVFVMKDAQGNEMGYYEPGHEGDPEYFHPYMATVSINIYERNKIIVTFYDEDQGMGESSGGTHIEVSYGTVLHPSDCPSTADNFLDWYTDRDFYNVYDFSTVITKNISLYARYTYTVTFDYMDGTTSEMYVPSSREGSPIMKAPKDPSRDGYAFGGWYKQSTCLEPWVFGAAGDLVTGNTTLYAKWVGQNVRLVFEYSKDGHMETLPYIIVPLTQMRSGFTTEVSGSDTLFEIDLDAGSYRVGNKIIYDVRIGADKFAAAEITFVEGTGTSWGYTGVFDLHNNNKTSIAVPVGTQISTITLVYKNCILQQDQDHAVFIGRGIDLTKLTSDVTFPSAGQTNFTVANSIIAPYSAGDRIVFDIVVNGNVYDAEFTFVEGSASPGTVTFKPGFKQSFELGADYAEDLTFVVENYTVQQGDVLEMYISDGAETVTGPYVKYGGTFNVIDIQHSGYLGYEITLLERAKLMVENELDGEKFIKWIVEYDGRDIPIYEDTVLDDRVFDLSTATYIDNKPSITLKAITKAVALEIVMEPITEDLDALITKGIVDGSWRNQINTTDLSATVRSPSTHLAYPEEDVPGGVLDADELLFKFELNNATRSGWYLTGWHSTHLSAASSLNPSAGNVRYLKIKTVTVGNVVSVDHEYVFSGDSTLTGQALWDALADDDNWNEMEFPNENRQLNDPNNPYIIRYVARWERIDYNFTVRESGHGVADAYLIKSDGTQERGDNFTVHYGDRIKLVYTTESRYEFYKWNYIGECEIEDVYSAETTLIITGDCIVFASDSGERVVRIYAQFDGDTEEATDSIFLRDSDGVDIELKKSPNVESETFVLYREYALRGTYTMLIKETVNEGLPDEEVVEYEIGQIEIGGDQPIFYYEIMSITLQIASEPGSQVYDVGVGDGIESYSKYVGRDRNSLTPVSAYIEISGGYEYLLEEGLLDAQGDYTRVKDINSNVSETMVAYKEEFYLSDAHAAGRAIRGYIAPIAYTVTYVVGDSWLHGDDIGKTVTVNDDVRTVHFNDNFDIVALSDIKLNGEDTPEWGPSTPGYQIFGFYGDTADGNYTIPVNNTTTLNSALLTSLGDRVVGHNITLYARIIYNPNSIVITVQVMTQNINDDNYTNYGDPISVDFIEESDHMYHGIHRFQTNNGYELKSGEGAVIVIVEDVGQLTPQQYSFTYNESGEMAFSISDSVVGEYPNAKDTAITLKFDRLTTRVYIDDLGGTISYAGWTKDDAINKYYKVARMGQVITIPAYTAPVDYTYEGWTEDGSGSFVVTEGVYSYTVTKEDVLAYKNSSTRVTFTPVITPMATVSAIFVTSIGRFKDGTQRITLTLTKHQPIRPALEEHLYDMGGSEMAPWVDDMVNYIFEGWDGGLPESFENISENSKTFVAKWTIGTHRLNYSVNETYADYVSVSATNDSSNTPAVSGGLYTHHSDIIMTIRTVPGWNLDIEATKAAIIASGTEVGDPVQINENTYRWAFFLDSDVTITLYGKASTMSVHFLVNGKLLDSQEAIKYQTIEFAQYIGQAGYDCSGEWYTDPECTQIYADYVVDEHGVRTYSLLVVEDTTLYTKATAHVYYVWYNVNGGDPGDLSYLTSEEAVRAAINDYLENGTPLPNCIQQFTVGKELTLNNFEYSKSGNIFAGWSGTASGDISFLRREHVTAGAFSNYDPESATGGVMTLYAYYLKINNHTGGDGLQNFLYDGHHHNGSIVNGTCTEGTSFVFKYSATQITSMDAGSADPTTVYFVDAGSHIVYYYGYVQVGDDTSRRQTIVGYFDLIIKPREVTFISGSITAVESGNPVVVRSFTWDTTQANEGIVGNEGQGLRAIYTYDLTEWPSTAGEYDNEFEVQFDGTIIKLSNYHVQAYEYGTITITTASEVIDIATTFSKTYGDAQFDIVATSTDSEHYPASGFVYTIFNNTAGSVSFTDKFGGGKTVTILKSGQATLRIFINQAASQAVPAQPNTYTDVLIDVQKKDLTITISVSDQSSLTKTYDRSATFSGTLVYDFTGLVQGDDVTVTANAAFNGVNAGAHAITISDCIFADDAWGSKYNIVSYTASISGAYINKREITITSPTAEKFYDGKVLTAPECIVEGTFAPNEGFSELKNATGAITSVIAGMTDQSGNPIGRVNNDFPAQLYTFNQNTSASNYEITLVVGTLTIKQATIVKPVVVGAYKYNMSEQSVNVSNGTASDRSLFTLLHDGTTSWSKATNVGDYDVTVRLVGNNSAAGVYNVKWSDGTYADFVLQWSIVGELINKNLFRLEFDSAVYKGSAWEPQLIVDEDPVTHKTYQLDRDYTFAYDKNRDTGTAEVIITASSNYGNEVFRKYFNITKYQVTLRVTSDEEFVYDGEEHSLATYGGELIADDRYGMPTLKATNFTISEAGVYVSEFYVEYGDGSTSENFNITVTNGSDNTFTRNVHKRQAYFVLGSSWKEFDGTALTDHTYTSIGVKPAHRSQFTVTFNPACTLTDVGTMANTATVTCQNASYDVHVLYGTITVVDSTIVSLTVSDQPLGFHASMGAQSEGLSRNMVTVVNPSKKEETQLAALRL